MTFEEFIEYYEDCDSPTLTKEDDDTYKLTFSSDYFLTITSMSIVAHNNYAEGTRRVNDYISYEEALDTITEMLPGEHEVTLFIHERDCEYSDYPLERDSQQQRFCWSDKDDPFFIAKTNGNYVYLEFYNQDEDEDSYDIEWDASIPLLVNNKNLACNIIHKAYFNLTKNGHHTARLDCSNDYYN